MAIITISSSFGTGGSVVAKETADSLGWRLLNRAITVEVATQLAMPLEVVEAHDERVETGWRRLVETFATFGSGQSPETSTSPPALNALADGLRLRSATEAFLRDAAKQDVVIVGRGAAIVLRNAERVLHVRLDGPRERRLRQGAEALHMSLSMAETVLEQTDSARAAYIREIYGRDWRDPSLYHLNIDSTALSIRACVKLILTAIEDRLAAVQL